METGSILYVITKATQGGAQLYVRELALEATRRGTRVGVVFGTPGKLSEDLANDSIRTIPIANLGRDIKILDEFRVFFRLISIFRKEEPTTVHVNSSKAGGLGALAARIALVPQIIYTAHGWPHKEPRPLLVRFIIWLLSWLTILLSTSVIVVSKDDYLRAPVIFFRKKVHLVRNGVEHFPLLSRDDARAKVLSKDSSLNVQNQWILCLGELHKNKGFDVLIRAFAKVTQDHPTTHLVILGGGEENQHLRTLATELRVDSRVHLLGFIDAGRSLLNAGDFFVFPSRKEGLPFALLEAGMAGLPVIASNVGGLPEVIEHEKTGLLVPPENSAALADAIDTLLSNKERAKQYGIALKAHVEKEFSKERMVRETFALYKN